MIEAMLDVLFITTASHNSISMYQTQKGKKKVINALIYAINGGLD
jgi:hypothetical protein